MGPRPSMTQIGDKHAFLFTHVPAASRHWHILPHRKVGHPLLMKLLVINGWHAEHLRTGCDLMNLFFVVDEYTDVESAPMVREMVDVVIDALKNPHKPRPQGEILLGQVAKE